MGAYTSISFKAIAAQYNALNAIPATAAAQIGSAVADCVGPNATLLDMGAGAGRITLPIATAGVRAIALDLELAMLRVSAENDTHNRLAHVNADVIHLPFQSNSLDAILTTNVLHLVAAWEQALAQAVRLLKPGGQLIIGRDVLSAETNANKVRNQLRRIVATIDPSMMPTAAAGPGLMQAIGKLGGQPTRPVNAASWHETLSVNQLIDRLANKQRNDTWALDDDLLAAAIAQLRPWAAQTFEDLDAPEQIGWGFQLIPVQFASQPATMSTS